MLQVLDAREAMETTDNKFWKSTVRQATHQNQNEKSFFLYWSLQCLF
jgi:hypothetical protein